MTDMNDNEDNMKNWCFFVLREVNIRGGEMKSLSKEVKIGDVSKQFNNFTKWICCCLHIKQCSCSARIYLRQFDSD